MMNCPLPIDWIEYLEGAVSDEFTTHLPKCRPCQLLVEVLRREKRPRLSRATFVESWPRWTEARDAAPAFGGIWWTSSESPEAQISIGFRIVVLVVSDVWQEHGRLWCEVVPLSTNVEDATSLDVVLLPSDTGSYDLYHHRRLHEIVSRNHTSTAPRTDYRCDEGRTAARTRLQP